MPDLGFLGGGNAEAARLHERPRPLISLPSYEPLFSETSVPRLHENVIKIIEVPAVNPVAILVSKLESILTSKAENDGGEEINRRIESSVTQTRFLGTAGDSLNFYFIKMISRYLQRDLCFK